MWAGFKCLGMPDTPPFVWHDLSLKALYDQIMPYALPFVVGGFVLSTIAAIVAYVIAYVVISRHRAHRADQTAPTDPLPPGQA